MRKKIFFVVSIFVTIGFFVFLNSRYYPVVLMYHKIDKPEYSKDSFAVSPEVFDQQMAFLKRRGYQVVSPDDLCVLISTGERLPRNLVTITFDDGYKDNLQAAKILQKYDLPGTIYIVLNRIDESGFLTRDDLVWISENTPVTFGSHTLNHTYFPRATKEEVYSEVIDSKIEAKKRHGLDLTTLAYPIGGFRPFGIEAVKKAGYVCAFTTNRGFQRKVHLYTIRRIKITDWDLGFRLWVKLSGFYSAFRRLR